MQIDYAAASCHGVFHDDDEDSDFAFPVEDSDDGMSIQADYWQLDGLRLTRVHMVARTQLFTPAGP